MADCHKHDFFSLKFYPKRYKKTDKKYALITNKGDLGNVLISCLNVIPSLLEKYPTASFGFAGARFEYPEISGYMLINRLCELGVEHREAII